MSERYDEFALARMIVASLDGEYHDGHEVFTSARVENGFRVIVKVTDAMDDSESIYTVTVAERESK